jgi:hypothetical protein
MSNKRTGDSVTGSDPAGFSPPRRTWTGSLGLAAATVAGLAGVTACGVANQQSGAATVRGSVASVDQSAGTFTVTATIPTGPPARCDRQSSASPLPANCPLGPPAPPDVTIAITNATRFQQCASATCSSASFANIKAGQTVVVLGSKKTPVSVAARQVSIVG